MSGQSDKPGPINAPTKELVGFLVAVSTPGNFAFNEIYPLGGLPALRRDRLDAAGVPTFGNAPVRGL